MTRTAFLGGDAFAVPSLRALAAHDSTQLVLVACPSERPSGRGMHVQIGPVPVAAEELGLECLRVTDASEIAGALESADLDHCVVCAFGMKLDERSLAAPRKGCTNIHASLLPRWRGAAPVERAILAGDSETGITTMRIAERIDAGDILLMESLAIGADETAGELRVRLADLGARLIVRTLVEFDTLRPQVQDPEKVTRARKIRKEEALLDWSEDAALLHRKVRAFNPRPGASCFVSGTRLKVLTAQVVDLVCEPMTLCEADRDTVTIACGKRCLRLQDVVPAGGKAMTAGAWLRGLKDPPEAGARVAGG